MEKQNKNKILQAVTEENKKCGQRVPHWHAKWRVEGGGAGRKVAAGRSGPGRDPVCRSQPFLVVILARPGLEHFHTPTTKLLLQCQAGIQFSELFLQTIFLFSPKELSPNKRIVISQVSVAFTPAPPTMFERCGKPAD